MIIVIASGRIRPDMRATFREAALKAIDITRQEPGCLAYDMYESTTEAERVVFIGRWASREIIDAHLKKDHMRAFFEVVRASVMEAPILEAIEPASIERL
jgi:quinol monooxygenase YgiN